ncbi:hypothetical protein AURANDRAFT_63568 [Aureococcus anophagefferens]|uniref:Uncharacterized protein n=1 Tax=Aureococcus anophagefferens TaxID=44056 RepID=F0Y7D4_AURAN|nr:hypothetical protein AURANDRAFT_63568 [Aureococcus anophagefferens]EGB08993.1 hypothetical protein AURANDRAFT_63568 [Aureococcus anophagefferens]|eukprot:XP_009036122.1 hypothetical protein AURANDRAFT_63568 [Aureococcus anophagefferens]
MSKKYRDAPLTNIPGPRTTAGQSYFRVEYLANPNNYLLSRLQKIFQRMTASAADRTDDNGVKGVRRVTFDEVVAKTVEQLCMCPAGVPGASNLMQASPDRPDEGNVDYAMDTFLIVWLGVNGSIISAWGKATAYMFDVLCGVSDVVVPVLGDMPAPAPKRTPAAYRDLARMLREGTFPPPPAAQKPKRLRVDEPSAPPAQAAASGPAVESPAAPAVDVAATVAATVVATPPPAGGPPVVVAPSPDERHKNARAALSQNRSESHALAIKTRDLENQLAELKAKMDRLDVEKPALECELKAAAKAAGRTHGAMDAFLGKRKAD